MDLAHDLTEVQNFASIKCIVGKEILEGAVVSTLELDEPAWTVRVFIELTMQQALLSFRCLVSGKEVGTTTASYRDVQESNQPLLADENWTSYSPAASYNEVGGLAQNSSVDEDPSGSTSPASDTSTKNRIIHRFTHNRAARQRTRKYLREHDMEG